MSQSIVQRKHVYPGNSGAFSSSVSTGNLILVFASAGATSGSAFSYVPTDTAGNTYTQLQSIMTAAGSGQTLHGLWYAKNVTGGSITLTVESKDDVGFTAYEISGADATSPISDSNNSKSGANPLVASLTMDVDGAIYCGWAAESGGNRFTSFTSSLTTSGNDAGHYDADGYLIPASAGTYSSVGANLTSGSSVNTIVCVAIRDSGGSPPAGHPAIRRLGGVGHANFRCGSEGVKMWRIQPRPSGLLIPDRSLVIPQPEMRLAN